MRRILDTLTSFLPVLERYPSWVAVLVAVWVILTAAILVVLVLAPRRPAAAGESPSESKASISTVNSPSATTYSAGRDIIIGSGSEASNSEQFVIHDHSALLSSYPGPLFYVYESKMGRRRAPVGYAVVIEVVNRGPLATGIRDYTLDAFVSGDWVRLPNLGALNYGQFYFATSDRLTASRRLDFSRNAFDALARDRVLQPGEGVRGWMFFEWPPHLRQREHNRIERLRLTVESTMGYEQVSELDAHRPRENGSTLAGTEMYVTGDTVDISQIPLLPHIDLLNAFKAER